MPLRNKTSAMVTETAILSVFSVMLQGFGLLLNIFLTRRLGSVSVGVLTLIGSFYGLAAVLSGGSGFVGASRFLSEEIGANGDPARVFRYILRFCMTISCTAAILLCVFAQFAAAHIPETTAHTIRLLSISLPISAFAACCKGRCYAVHRVYVPAVAECIEFLLRAGTMAFCAIFLIPYVKLTVLDAFALSMLTGQGASAIFLAFAKIPYNSTGKCRLTFASFIRHMLPIVGNACLVAILSSANDALVPLTLVQFGNSTNEALSQFGEFEAIIIPMLFFPSVMQCCMSGLLVPELSNAAAADDTPKIKRITENVLEQTVAYALFVAYVIFTFGEKIGVLLGGDAFTGSILRWMAPIVPCIYLEIIMEGILRGLGKQNFSSINYLAEYMVRISVLLICVPLFGFYGIVASYMACNLTGNSVRLYMVWRVTKMRPSVERTLLQPIIALILSWQLGSLMQFILHKLHLQDIPAMILSVAFSAAVFAFTLKVLRKVFVSKKQANTSVQAAV